MVHGHTEDRQPRIEDPEDERQAARAHHGFRDFVLCLGYKAEAIKWFFLTYNEAMANDFVLTNGGAEVHLLKTDIHDWNITFVDTGLHSKKWTREQVVQFFHDHSAIDEVEVQSETDRYIAWPGQALGYKMGQLKILELRERAKKALGSRFDLRKFHDTVRDYWRGVDQTLDDNLGIRRHIGRRDWHGFDISLRRRHDG